MYVINQFTAAVGLTDTALLPGNEQRVGLVISSPLANDVSLSLVGPAVVGQGVTLHAGGDPLVMLPGAWG